ncbi:YdcF family protein [Paenibacillus sp. GSMTC-2017]|uniref:YdcF family protein n=1 Tax=Paenibacillus sp. GSMTC-2017 TaxID=2794350 RepID=UPI0018D63EE9|nr:YdcF family protein [Paenibacillus sp. GSMTC-2017]MBH5317796.1 YdcF family protein [Paenibacillus sp. GSMTC-2017]
MKSVPKKRSKPRKRKRAFRPWLLFFRFIMWSLVAGIFWCGYLYWVMNNYSAKDTYPKADAGIVLGAALWGDTPSPALKERLDFAIVLLENGTVKSLILTGGVGGRSSTLSEAEGMRNYLLLKGVAEDKLLLEKKASSTYQNIVFSRNIGESKGIKSYLIITHDYHAARANEIATFAGLETKGVAGVQSRVLNEFYNDTREVLAFTKWKLDWLTFTLGLRSPE